MKSNKAGALALTIILALALACLAPCAALADAGPLAAGAAEVSTQALPAEAHVAYAANAGGKWAWKQDGATSSVAKGRQVARLRVRVSSTLPGSVQYQAYVSGEGWQAARADGAAAGKKSRRVEAVRIALTGELSARYDVLYRVKTSKGKWQAWRANGQAAGKAGAKVRAVQVALAPKGAAGAASPGIVPARYRAKPQGSSWQPWKSDGAKAGKSGRRLSALAASVDAGDLGGGVRYRALLSSGRWTGWKADGRKLSTKKRVVAVQVELYGGMASRYDVAYATGNKKSGWSPYSRNGATSQPAKGKQIETIRILLVDKPHPDGWFKEEGSWRYYEGGTGVSYRQKLRLTEDYRAEFAHGRKGAEYQKYIVLHDTEMDSDAQNVIDYWDGNDSGVAAHFIVNKDGSIMQCVPLDSIAHHAGFGDTGHNRQFGVEDESRDDKVGTVGIGNWARDYGMNSHSIGIEIVHVGGSSGYPEAQLNALDNLIAYIDAYYGKKSSIIDHKAWRTGNSDTSREFATYLANYQDHRTHLAA